MWGFQGVADRETQEPSQASRQAPLPAARPEGTPLTSSLSLGECLTGRATQRWEEGDRTCHPHPRCPCLGLEAEPEPGRCSRSNRRTCVLGPRSCPGPRGRKPRSPWDSVAAGVWL